MGYQYPIEYMAKWRSHTSLLSCASKIIKYFALWLNRYDNKAEVYIQFTVDMEVEEGGVWQIC